jgi:hypothetical protein
MRFFIFPPPLKNPQKKTGTRIDTDPGLKLPVCSMPNFTPIQRHAAAAAPEEIRSRLARAPVQKQRKTYSLQTSPFKICTADFVL